MGPVTAALREQLDGPENQEGLLPGRLSLLFVLPMLTRLSETTLRFGRVSQIGSLLLADKRGTTDRVDRGTRCAEQRMC